MLKTLCAAALMAAARDAYGYDVVIPPGNIVLNPTFQQLWTNWNGVTAATVNAPTIPGNNCSISQDVYQNLPTVPGQQYLLSFYTAADLYFAPSLTLNVDINNQVVATYITPSYTYDPTVNRTDQMRWEQLGFTFVATSTTTKLEFVDLNTYDFGLAAVSVIPVPEPGSGALLILGAGIFGAAGTRRWRANKVSQAV